MDITPTATIEDYLGIIYTLQRDGEKVIGARLAEILEVSPPTVTATLKRMVRDGWVRMDGKKNISLTETGREAARSVIRRHMLTEWLLSRVLQIPMSELHDEAHKIEHTISPQVEEQLISSMENPEVCPHGNPLPGLESASRTWLPMSDFEPGEIILLRRIHELLEEDHQIMRFLDTHQIQPGVHIQIKSRDADKKTIEIDIDGSCVKVPFTTAQKLFVEKQS